MGAVSRYWQLVRLNPSGGIRTDSIQVVEHLFERRFPAWIKAEASPVRVASPQENRDIQIQLFNLMQTRVQPGGDRSRNSEDAVLAELSLKCFISHCVVKACRQLEAKFGSQHGFRADDLFPFVLDLDTPLRRGQMPSDLLAVTHDRPGQYRSVIHEVLQRFDPTKGGLATWTYQVVRSHGELTDYLADCGLCIITDWAILNESTPSQVKRILSGFHSLSSAEILQACTLLESYHGVYRHDRLKHQLGESRRRCEKPTSEQLRRIGKRYAELAVRAASPQENRLSNEQALPTRSVALGESSGILDLPTQNILTALLTLASRLRQYRIHLKGSSYLMESLDQLMSKGDGLPQLSTALAAGRSDPLNCPAEQQERSEFTAFCREQLQEGLDWAIAQVMNERIGQLQRKTPSKIQQFLQGLHLFYGEQQSMGDIAPQIGLRAQYQVTRLLKLGELQAQVRQKLIGRLQDQLVPGILPYLDPDQIQNLDRTLRDALETHLESVMEDTSEGRGNSQNSRSQSLFAHRVCNYLDTRQEKSC
jgi:hypothetical protein